ncbi:MAG: hypothetical protein JXJ17_01495 [Anaerolineae bacterium]|nr:hypothetical protein [Anaerolineae bacterium]
MRIPFIEKRLPAPGIGSPHLMFEYKLNQMDQLIEDGAGFNCIIVGSSIAYRGIHPGALAESIQSEPGADPLRCYNFGLSQVTASEVGVITPVLVKRYDLDWVIYATSIRDYTDKAGDQAKLALLNTPWMIAAQGQPSLAGWLSHHSRLYQTYLSFSQWFREDLWNEHQRIAETPFIDGYEPFPAAEGAGLPSPDDFPVWLSIQFEDYEVSENDLQGLDQLLALDHNGIHVVVVEMPLPATYHTMYTPADYDDFLTAVRDHTGAAGVPLIEAPADLIPTDGWADYHHLNEKGAAIFSTWLGHELAQGS